MPAAGKSFPGRGKAQSILRVGEEEMDQ